MTSLKCLHVALSYISSSSLWSIVLSTCTSNNIWTSILSLPISSTLNMTSSFLYTSWVNSNLICITKKKLWIVFLAAGMGTFSASHVSKVLFHPSCASWKHERLETSGIFKIFLNVNVEKCVILYAHCVIRFHFFSLWHRNFVNTKESCVFHYISLFKFNVFFLNLKKNKDETNTNRLLPHWSHNPFFLDTHFFT